MSGNKLKFVTTFISVCFFAVYYASIAMLVYVIFSPKAVQQQFLEHFEKLFIFVLCSGFFAACILFIFVLPLVDDSVTSFRKGRGYFSEGLTTSLVWITAFIKCFLPLILLSYGYQLSDKTSFFGLSTALFIFLLLVTLNHFKALALLRRKRCA